MEFQFQTKAIDPSQMCDEGYAFAVLLPVFAAEMAPFSGRFVEPQVWVKKGMKRVFDWMCQNGMACGDPNMVDAAADAAYTIASYVYNDRATLDAAFEALGPHMATKLGNCRGIQQTGLNQG